MLPTDGDSSGQTVRLQARNWLHAERVALVSLVKQTAEAALWQISYDLGLCIEPFLQDASLWWELEIVYAHGLQAATELNDRQLQQAMLHGQGVMLRNQGRFPENIWRS